MKKQKNTIRKYFNIANLGYLLLVAVACFAYSEFRATAAGALDVTVYISNANNAGLVNGDYQVRFALYDSDRQTADLADSDPKVWEETQTVTVRSGILKAYLGDSTPLPATINFKNQQYYLGIKIGSDSEAVPRKKIGAVPLAITAVNALTAQTISGYSIGNATGNIPVSNGTLNTNLNADLLDGLHSTAFQPAGTYLTSAPAGYAPWKLQSGSTDAGQKINSGKGAIFTGVSGITTSRNLNALTISPTYGSVDNTIAQGSTPLVISTSGNLQGGGTGTAGGGISLTLDMVSSPSFFQINLLSSSGNSLGFKAPAGVAANQVWNLPGADGTPNQSLVTDGTGNLSWAMVGAGAMDGSGTAGYATFWTDADTLAGEQYLSVSRGGTGLGSFVKGSIPYSASANSLTTLTGLAADDGENLKFNWNGGNPTLSWEPAAGGFTSFTAAGDSGGGRTISDGNILTIAGGTNLTTVDSDMDTVTVNLDGTLSGVTWNGNAISVTYGGTGAGDAATARTNLGLAISSNVQAYNASLAAISGGTWTGAASITTVGTIGTGTWNATAIADSKVSALASATQGDVLYHNGTSWTKLVAGTSGQYLKTLGAAANPMWDNATGTTYTASGTLLNLSTTTFSLKEGALTDGLLCTYVAGAGPGTGLVCNTALSGVGVAYTAGSGLTLGVTEFKLGGTITENTSLNLYGASSSRNLRFYNSNISAEALYLQGADGNVGIGNTAPTQKLDVTGYANASSGLCIGGDCKTSWAAGGVGSNYWQRNGTNVAPATIGDNVGIGTTAPGNKFSVVGDADFTGSLGVNGAAVNNARGINIAYTDEGAASYGVYNTLNTNDYDIYGMYNGLTVDTASETGYGAYNSFTLATNNYGYGAYNIFSSGAYAYGAYNRFNSFTATGGAAYGVNNYSVFTATSGSLYGAYNYFTSGGNNSLIYGIYNDLAGSTNNQTLYGAYTTLTTQAGDTGYGEYIIDASASSGGTTYGLYVNLDDPDVTNKFSVYVAGTSASSYFGSNVGIGTTLPSQLFQINNSGSTAFVVTSGGNVGIGTTNPGAALEINGQVKITGGVPGANKVLTSDAAGLATWETAAASGANTALSNLANVAINTSLLPASDDAIDLGDNTHRWRDLYLGPATLHIGTSTSDEGTISYATGNNVLNFQSTGDIALQSASGNVGIGTTAPTVALDVNGAIRATSISNTSGTSGMSLTTAGSNKTVDLMEYASDSAAQTAYATSAPYTSQYPTLDDAHVTATSNYPFGTYSRTYYTTDPSLSLIGSYSYNQWIGYPPNNRFNIDLGSAKTITRIYYENSHDSGTAYTEMGVKNFTFWGSNTAGISNVTWKSDADMITEGWTQITCDSSQFDRHVALNQADPKYIKCTNTTAYRYYGFKFADNWGDVNYMGIRRIELQTGTALQDYSEPTIKQEGSYSLKGVATMIDSLNATLTKTFSPTLNLSDKNFLNFDIRSSRTGSNIKVAIHDSGGTTTDITPNILVADTWQTVNLDLSGVANANKDSIDSVIVTIVNADAANTFYIDKMYVTPVDALGNIAFTTNSVERMRIDSSGFVGIGTTNPQYKLDVNGDMNLAAGSVYRIGGIEQTGSSKWTAGTGDNIYRALGNVGIGTTSPDYKLNVAGDINITGNYKINGVNLAAGMGGSGTAGYISLFATSTSVGNSAIYQSSGNLGIGTTLPSQLFQINNSGSSAFVVTSGGNVGIGTTSPGNKLTISGGVGIGTTAPGSLFLSTKAPDGGLIIEGNVGIGTTNPLHKLDINGNLGIAASGYLNFGSTDGTSGYGLFDNSGTLQYKNSGGSWTSFGGASWSGLTVPTGNLSLAMSTYTTAFNWATGTSTNNLFSLTTDASSNGTGYLMNLATGASSTVNPFRVSAAGTEVLMVNAGGNVGIGTTAPDTFKLQVAGSVGPQTDVAYDLGDNTHRWRDLYLGSGSLHIGTSTSDEGTISYATSNNVLQLQSTGDIALQSASGNVGIGTTAPGNKLTISGGVGIGTTAPGSAFLSTKAPDGGLIVEGNVGIGTTVPSYNLDVAGSFRVVVQKPSMSATGGTVTYSGGYTIHTFTTDGTFTPSVSGDVEVLVVGGGAGGAGAYYSGGGGGGGIVATSVFVSAAQSVAVGGGGNGGSGTGVDGSPGGDSGFGGITAGGGGGGGSYNTPGLGLPGRASNGSGGGNSQYQTGAGGAGNGTGHNGGSSVSTGGGGGGGGAGVNGANGTVGIGGAGGDGLPYSYSGSEAYYGGGGGGAGRTSGTGGAGGTGGGGAGAGGSGNPTAGTANTGGGGGGSNTIPVAGANGGSGIVIIRYLTDSSGIGSISTNAYGDITFGNTAGVGNRCVYADSNGSLHAKGDDCGTAGASGDNWGSQVVLTDDTLVGNGFANRLGIDLTHANTWSGAQTFSANSYFTANSYFPGNGIWNANGNVGIGTTGPSGKLDIHGLSTGTGINTQWADSTGAAKVSILDNGNVGIGTTAPGAKLEVNSGSSGVVGIKLTQVTSGSSAGAGNGKVLGLDASGNIILVTDQTGTGTSLPTGTFAGQTLYYNGSNWGTNVNLFNNGGNVGIGTTTPGAALDVNGAIRTTSISNTGGTNGMGMFLSADKAVDLMEYADDAAAQAAYVTSAPYTSHYPPAYNTTYVKETTHQSGGAYAYYAFDPSTSLIGANYPNGWESSGVGDTNQRVNVDLGSAQTTTRIYYENFHATGTKTDEGARNFTFWGSNTAGISNVTWKSDADMITEGWTQITCESSQFEQHVAANQADPKYINCTNTTAYRYYGFKFADNYGYASYMGVRRIELQAAPFLPDYSEPIIKQEGSSSLKGVAAITTSLNQTLTRTVAPALNLSGRDTINFDIRASRTGSNIKIGIHDSGGNTTEITPNIAQADTWQTVSWDISGVGNFSKDAIDQIIVTVVNADAANTFYIDNMHAPSNSATGDIVFTTSNAERIRIDENGYVGIGTATPANALDIGNGGGIHIASGTPGSTNMALYNNAGTLTWNGVALATGGSSISGTANYIPIFTGVATLGNSAIYQTGGNVGIGTTAPGNKLSISGGVGIGTTAPGSRFLSTKAPDGGLIVEGNVGIGTTSPRALLDVNGSTWLRGAVGGTSGLYVNSAGNVGIGTTNPSYKLDLAGDINITGSYRVNGTALAAGMGGSGTANYLPIFATGTTLGNSAIYQTSGNLGIGTTLPSQLFQINNSGSTAFVVTSGGNVGIGTTNPGAALEINGQVKITGGVPGANKILTSDINGLATWETAAASGATIALDNLANVAINTSLLPSGNNGIDLGDNTHRWRDLYLGPASLHIGTSTSDEGTISYATSNNVLNFQSTGNLAFQSTGGNVGIGTTAPTNLLDVAGGMKIGAGYAGIGTTAPTNGLLIQGNVGIGTTNPGAALDVNGAIRTTSISNTGGTNGMGMFLSADKAVDLMEYADDAAAQAAYAGVETPSYASSGGTGDRTATITATTDLTTFGNVSTLLDGALSNVHYWNNAQDVTGKYVKFQFASPKLITEATWYQDAQVQGTWKWQGSNDNSNWTDIGSSFTLNNGVLTQLSGNTTAYLYYRMLGVSGTTSSSPWMREIEFKIADASVEAYSEPTIKQEGSFSLKGVAAITTSLNKTRTRTVAPALNLSGRDTINFDIRAARTGSNIKIGFHDSGGNTTEITPNIAQADTWQTVSWDISGVGNANKDAIDQIIVTVVNADAANTFYVDNMHAPSNSTTGDIAFTTSNAESMRIDEYGSVGIGTATPNYKLDVATDIASNYSANFFNDGNNVNRYGIRVQSGADNCSTTGTCQILDYFDGDGTAAGGLRIVTGTVGVYQPSDRRLKTDIAGTVKVGLDIINGLRVVDFRRTSGGSTGPMQTGFIAQEAQGVFPEMVAPTPDGYLAISEGMLIPVLTKAIQEQQGMIIQQQAQNTLQETAISDVNLKTSQNVETVGQLQKSVDDNLTVISSNFSAVDTKLALHDSAMANVNAQFTALDTKVSNIDVQIADLASKYTALNTGMSLSETEKTDLENRLAAAEASLVENQHDLITFEKGTNDTLSSMLDTEDMLTNRVLDHEDRLKALEDQVATMTVAAGGEIPANVVTQDALGNVTLAGVFRAKEVETQGIVAGDVSIKNQDTDSPTIGKAILKSGETEIIILTKAVTENSRILVTPEVATSQPLAATQKIAGESFKVEVEIPASKDIEFSWLIIEEKK